MKTNEQFSGVTRRVHTLWNVILDNRMARAMNEGISRYPIYRVLHFAARIELEVLLDAIALDPTWRAERTGYEEVMLDGDGVLIVVEGSRKVDYCSCSFYIWAADVARAEEAKLLEQLRVVVRGEHDAVAPAPGNRGDDIDHPHTAERRLGVERLLARLDARRFQFRDDVGAAVGERRRTGGSRAKCQLPAQVLPRPVAIESAGIRDSGFGIRRIRTSLACGTWQCHDGENHEHEVQEWHTQLRKSQMANPERRVPHSDSRIPIQARLASGT